MLFTRILLCFGLGKNGKTKMHELYTIWLSCKGVWGQCSLVIKASQKRSQDHEETYDFLSKDALIKELGCELLAKDLMERHAHAEQKHPQFPDREDLYRYKCFVSFRESYKKSTGTEVTGTREATIEEDDFDAVMEDAAAACPSGDGLMPGAGKSVVPNGPKPSKPTKTPKQKNSKQILEQANSVANRNLTESLELKHKLESAGADVVSQAYKAALLKDLESASQGLAAAKDNAVVSLASNNNLDSSNKELSKHLEIFKKIAGAVRGHIKPKSKAKAKAKPKASPASPTATA
eukprot:s5036_g1.t1